MTARKRSYRLTGLARRQLREAKTWSRARWGDAQTIGYFTRMDSALSAMAENPARFHARAQLSGGTRLSVLVCQQHYIVCDFTQQGPFTVVAVYRQGRNIPEILRRNADLIAREVQRLEAR